jgi:transcriptional regulator with XRE-family HTH domain
MSVYFSEKFKQLRKAKDLTQEQIADIFHVSPKCVSRWETGANYPDVEMLPHIAIYFKVTLDELFETEKIRSEEKVEEYIRDIRNLMNSGKLNDAIELARKGTKEYPMNHSFPYHLLQALRTDGSEKHKAEIITVGERVINLDPNNWGIKGQLVQMYGGWGMKEEAQKILDTMPGEIWDSREVWKGFILEGEELRKHYQARIIRIYYLLDYFIQGYMGSGIDVLQKIYWKKAFFQIGNLISKLYDEGAREVMDSGDSSKHLESAFFNIGLAELYCEAGDSENALECVEQAAQDSMHHIDIMDKTTETGANYMAWSTPRNLPWILWEDNLSKPQFDIIRNEQRFIKCFDELKANSRELK